MHTLVDNFFVCTFFTEMEISMTNLIGVGVLIVKNKLFTTNKAIHYFFALLLTFFTVPQKGGKLYA